MRRLIRILTLSIALLAGGVGAALGQYGGEYFDGKIRWSYFMVEIDKTCRINPVDKSAIRGAVFIPSEVVTAGGLKLRVVEIHSGAFESCEDMTSVVIPEGVATIDMFAFANCTGLTTVTLPNSVTKIEAAAFMGCHGLTTAILGSGVAEIEPLAFSYCSRLKEFAVDGSNAKYMGSEGVLFDITQKSIVCCGAGMTGDITLSNVVEVIWHGAFAGCDKLTSVSIPSSVETIEAGAFDGCTALKKIVVGSNNPNYCAVDGVLFNRQKTELLCCPGGFEGEYGVPSGVEYIAFSAFSQCVNLTGVKIPDGVTVGEYAFARCVQLEEVVFPRDVRIIGAGTFVGCAGLRKVKIPNTVEVIANGAFSECEGLRSVFIPSSVTTIGERAFAECSNLYEVYWIPGTDCEVGEDVFFGVPSGSTLCVMPDEKAKIKSQGGDWWKVFSTFVEGCLVTFEDFYGQRIGSYLVIPGDRIWPPTLPVTPGKSYGWFVNGIKFDFTQGVRTSLTLRAKWIQKPLTAVESHLLAQAKVVSNPIGSTLRLRGMRAAEKIEVFNLRGQLECALVLAGEESVALDASGWASGFYVARITAEDGVRTLRFVKP